MIKGEVEEITLTMRPEEVEVLVKQYNEAEVINIMGKRYVMRAADCVSGIRYYSGDYKTKVTIRLQEIKKGV